MNSIEAASPEKSRIKGFFDEIAARYDFLNSLLSFRLDSHWRRRSRKLILDGHERSILDLGVGTGKFLQLFLGKDRFRYAVGLDFSSGMLSHSRSKISGEAGFVSGDFHALPFRENSFDLVISSFTLRSVKELPLFCKEIYDVLTPHGKVAFLCLTRPQGWFWRFLYYPYLNFYLPLMGRLVSGGSDAYQFLSKSVQTFQEPGQTLALLRRTGFHTVQVIPMSFGIATLIIAKK